MGSLRGPAWRTGFIEHQASRTNGHALEEKEGRKEGEVCLYIGGKKTDRHRDIRTFFDFEKHLI